MGVVNLKRSLLGGFSVNRSWEINSACTSIWEKTGGQISSRVFKIKDSIAFIQLTIKNHAFYNPLGKAEQTWGFRPVCTHAASRFCTTKCKIEPERATQHDCLYLLPQG